MRLIDADSIRGCAKYIKTNEKFEPYIMIDDLAKLLDEQQTAYDIGKVVKELEETKETSLELVKLPKFLKKDLQELVNMCFDEAIEIVNQGGLIRRGDEE